MNKNQIEHIVSINCSSGYRAICFCYKKLSSLHKFTSLKEEKDLIFLSVCFLKDLIRAEVPEAVLQLKTAGVITRMITGDGIDTAKAIAL